MGQERQRRETLIPIRSNVSSLKIRENQDVSFTNYIGTRLSSATEGTMEASNCNSPSNLKSTCVLSDVNPASTAVYFWVEAEPFVENVCGYTAVNTCQQLCDFFFSTVDSARYQPVFASWVRQYAAVGERSIPSSYDAFLLVNMNAEEDAVLRPGYLQLVMQRAIRLQLGSGTSNQHHLLRQDEQA